MDNGIKVIIEDAVEKIKELELRELNKADENDKDKIRLKSLYFRVLLESGLKFREEINEKVLFTYDNSFVSKKITKEGYLEDYIKDLKKNVKRV